MALIKGTGGTAARPIKTRLGPNPKFSGNSRPGSSIGTLMTGGELPRTNENKNPLFKIFKTSMTKKNETVTLNRAKAQGVGTLATVKKEAQKQVLSRKQLDDELEQYRKQRGHQKKTPATTTVEDLDKEMDEYNAVAKMKKELKEKAQTEKVPVAKDDSEPMEVAVSHAIV